MGEWIIAVSGALWLGVLTSLGPCTLATNVVAIAYVGRRVERPWEVLVGGLVYAIGRALAYVALAVAMLSLALSTPRTSLWLQHYMPQLLGPILVVVGLALLQLIRIPWPSFLDSKKTEDLAMLSGPLGPFLLGVLFALTFCPTSAVLFFGSLIPLALNAGSRVALPLAFGLGTALPVVVLATGVALVAGWVGPAYVAAQRIERKARLATGIVFLVIGCYDCLKYSLHWL